MFPIHKEFVPRSLTLLSVYPVAKKATMRHIGNTNYVIPAAGRDVIRIAQPDWSCKIFDFQRDLTPIVETPCERQEGYSLLRIYDTFQTVPDPATGMREDKPIMVEFVRQDLLRQWVSQSFGSNLGASGPGIIPIQGPVPTQEEIARARAMQHEFFTALVMAARDLYTNGKSKDINVRHRMAGEHLGLTAASDKWLTVIRQSVTKNCGACAKEMPREAIVCESCGVNLVKFYTEMKPYGITPEANLDTFVAEILARRPEPEAPPAVKTAPIIPPPRIAPPLTQPKQPGA